MMEINEHDKMVTNFKITSIEEETWKYKKETSNKQVFVVWIFLEKYFQKDNELDTNRNACV